LGRIITDLEIDDERTLEVVEDGYIFTSRVNYSNNNNLIKQRVHVDEDLNIIKVEVLNSQDAVEMSMVFTDINENKGFSESDFEIDGNMGTGEVEPTMNRLEDIIFPVSLPVNTFLSGQDTVSLDTGERVILTFDGDSPFILIQETATVSNTLRTNRVLGEPQLIRGTIGAQTDNTVSWVSNGIEFFLVSDAMAPEELLRLARSVSIPVSAK
jgi:predicted transport protein